MISIKRILYLFAIAALLAMSPGGGADQANFPDIYIDGASGGDGSLATPYSDFASINWTTGGDNSVYDAVAADKDVTINLKRGVTWNEKMTVGCSGSAEHPITIQAYGSGADPILNATGAIPGWGTGGNWTTSYGADLVTNGGFTDVSVTGSEMLTNGDMELDANWVPWVTPDTEEQSTEQKHGGSNSWKVIHSSSGSGIHNEDVTSLVLNKTYRVNFWVYPSGTSVGFGWRSGDGSWEWQSAFLENLNANAWNEVSSYYIEDAGGTFADMCLESKYSGTWYFDDASVKEVVFDNWTQGTGWRVGADSRALTTKAEKLAGTASNLEQSGLTAIASTTYKIVWTVADRTAGTVQLEIGSTNGASQNTNDTFTEYITASDTDHLKIKADSSFDGTVDSVAVYKQGEVWYIQNITVEPYRVWIDGTEYMRAETDQTNIDATHRFWYDSGNDYLYVYSTAGNPADEFTTLVGSYIGIATDAAIKIVDFSYITVQNLDLRGGYSSVYIYANAANVTKIIFDGCAIGKNFGMAGIHSASYNDSYDVTYCEIKNCTLDANCSLSYDWNAAGSNVDYPASFVYLNMGSQYWKIHDNTIQDCLHTAILVTTTNTGRDTIYNEAYDNIITFSSVNVGRAVAVGGDAGCTCSYNKFYRNYIQDSGLFVNFGGTHNEFTYNIVNTVTNPSYAVSGLAYGIIVRPMDDTSSNHKICNNVFYNCEEPGIAVSDAGTATPVADSEISNNIIMNCGTNSLDSLDDIQLEVAASCDGNTYRTNIAYKSGVTDVFDYRGTPRTIAEFNGETGNNSDTMTDNIGGDPLMTDPGNDDFTLQVGSPCINRGTFVGLILDYLGLPVPIGHRPDIGAYEHKNGGAVIH